MTMYHVVALVRGTEITVAKTPTEPQFSQAYMTRTAWLLDCLARKDYSIIQNVNSLIARIHTGTLFKTCCLETPGILGHNTASRQKYRTTTSLVRNQPVVVSIRRSCLWDRPQYGVHMTQQQQWGPFLVVLIGGAELL
jgi:hypothetical protein